MSLLWEWLNEFFILPVLMPEEPHIPKAFKAGFLFYNMYSVYVLVRDKKPVYIGCTSSIKNRLSAHKRAGKIFDTYRIIESFKNKKEAYIAERALIKYYSQFGDGTMYNAEYVLLSYDKQFYL